MNAIDEYLQTCEPAMRAEMQRIRTIAQKTLPEYTETIWYNMPTLQYRGVSVISFDAHKNHVGIYPCSGRVIDRIAALKKYDTTKGAIREKLDNLLPDSLLEEIIRLRLQDIETKE